MKSGLYAFAGASATATAAAWANRLLAPMTNVSKVYFVFSRAGSPGVLPPDGRGGALSLLGGFSAACGYCVYGCSTGGGAPGTPCGRDCGKSGCCSGGSL